MTTQHAMIDLFVPSSAGDIGAIQTRASEAGLDAFVYVVEHPDDLPTPDSWSVEQEQPRVLLGCALKGNGYRLVVVLSEWEEANFEILEATDDLNLLVAAAVEMGGAAYIVSQHQSDEREVIRKTAPLADGNSAGVVAMVAGVRPLARDLDVEQAVRAERPILAATGPFGALADVGRFATFMMVDSLDSTGIITAINSGAGVAAEIGETPSAKSTRGQQKNRRRRRRRRGSNERAPKDS